jgi:hypothetical protein
VVGRPVPFVGDAVALIGHALALVGEAVALIGGDSGLVERRPAPGQVGLGGLQGLFGGLGVGLGLPDPGVVQGQGGQPLTLGVLDDLMGQLGQLARGRPGPPPQPPERLLRGDALGGGEDPFGLLDPDPAGQRLAQLASSSSRVASSTLVWTSSPATVANSPAASSSWVVQARGWVL